MFEAEGDFGVVEGDTGGAACLEEESVSHGMFDHEKDQTSEIRGEDEQRNDLRRSRGL